MPLRLNREICRDLPSALRREWLETNGIGGFSSSTIIGLNTRRYHGLLTAATQPPGGRLLLLSKLDETAVVNGKSFDLAANRYPGVVHPTGYHYLKQFRLDPFPIFTYEIDGLEIEKRIFMVHGENTTVIEYDLPPGCVLELRPLIAFRDYHSTTHRNPSLNPAVTSEPGRASVQPYPGLPTLHFHHNAAEIVTTGDWYLNFEFDIERDRGLDFQEDLFNPFLAIFTGPRATVIASTTHHDATQSANLRRQEIERRAAIIAAAPSIDPLVQTLVAAADQYIVQRGDLKTIIAGYHWFGDWGRDTMIALPGLTLVTGRFEIAKSILLAFAKSVDQGMLPNRFPDTGETPEYNTVDATLWFFEAVRALLHYTQDSAFVKENLYDTLHQIIDWHLRGTRYGIHVDADGLLSAGEAGVQLTWMDAKIGDHVVTPRHGKPVEIQALWYNALRIMEDLAAQFGDHHTAIELRELAARARASFNNRFWNETGACLYDVVNGSEHDAAIRPNQIFAVSLHHSMLEMERARKVVAVVERDLLTPRGLRTLSPKDPNYRPRYEGNVWDRDSAYHQGTVWPWLMGPFITAYKKVNGHEPPNWLSSFEDHLTEAGLNQISEIADADQSHTPRGCIAQAWSVAELLRATIESA